jgi:hypothetical protein
MKPALTAGVNDFCLQEYFSTGAVFRTTLLLFNLPCDYQQAIGMNKYR